MRRNPKFDPMTPLPRPVRKAPHPMSDDYTFDKMLTNLQGLADEMTEQAMNVNASPRVIAAALDATIENLLWLIRHASISWAAMTPSPGSTWTPISVPDPGTEVTG